MYQAERYHDISCGHRVHMHESKCRHLHGHNYRIHFTCQAESLDNVGRVIDFSDIKSRLCMWVEENWDHKFLMWEDDPMLMAIARADTEGSIVMCPFNPTAENMAKFLVDVVGPEQLKGTGIKLVQVRVEETRKCSATYVRKDPRSDIR